ncbi:hypothetical protein cand_020800 [Cryptosporidium andersoni]|uniref:Uncharacterized protein n=1 Tax=Cryptosporidium andersoni TaxID=117008 RepID=A0A1J4MS86_9CRYT|nr:hypothetical protein cand_020800 [Cryptosporidium andersoni]
MVGYMDKLKLQSKFPKVTSFNLYSNTDTLIHNENWNSVNLTEVGYYYWDSELNNSGRTIGSNIGVPLTPMVYSGSLQSIKAETINQQPITPSTEFISSSVDTSPSSTHYDEPFFANSLSSLKVPFPSLKQDLTTCISNDSRNTSELVNPLASNWNSTEYLLVSDSNREYKSDNHSGLNIASGFSSGLSNKGHYSYCDTVYTPESRSQIVNCNQSICSDRYSVIQSCIPQNVDLESGNFYSSSKVYSNSYMKSCTSYGKYIYSNIQDFAFYKVDNVSHCIKKRNKKLNPNERNFYIVDFISELSNNIQSLYLSELKKSPEMIFILKEYSLGSLAMRRSGSSCPVVIKCFFHSYRDGISRLQCKTRRDEGRHFLFIINETKLSRPWVLCPNIKCIKRSKSSGKLRGRVKIYEYCVETDSIVLSPTFLKCANGFLTEDYYLCATLCPQQKYADHESNFWGEDSVSGFGGNKIQQNLACDAGNGSGGLVLSDYILFCNSKHQFVATFKKSQCIINSEVNYKEQGHLNIGTDNISYGMYGNHVEQALVRVMEQVLRTLEQKSENIICDTQINENNSYNSNFIEASLDNSYVRNCCKVDYSNLYTTNDSITMQNANNQYQVKDANTDCMDISYIDKAENCSLHYISDDLNSIVNDTSYHYSVNFDPQDALVVESSTNWVLDILLNKCSKTLNSSNVEKIICDQEQEKEQNQSHYQELVVKQCNSLAMIPNCEAHKIMDEIYSNHSIFETGHERQQIDGNIVVPISPNYDIH